MSTDKQVEANRKNAQKSTGPEDCDRSKYNAVKYGLTSISHFSKEEESTINDIYNDLGQILTPKDKLQEFLLGRMALYMWRLQKSSQIEQKQFKNSLIDSQNKQGNKDKQFIQEIQGRKPNITGENIDTNIDLIMRYESTNENRLIRLVKFFKELQT
ncbi:MAG: hypothetical protein V1866_04195 [archaeon]